MAKTIGIQFKLHINRVHRAIGEKHVSKLTLKENKKQNEYLRLCEAVAF